MKTLEAFITPPKKYRPFVRWWWPGLAVEPEILEKELILLNNAGFGGAEIQIFLIGGSGGASKELCHRMMPNPYYYSTIYHVLKEANKKDFKIDLTFGSSWPPGSTSINKNQNLKTLLIGLDIFRGGQKIETETPQIQINAYYKYRKIMKLVMGDIQDDFQNYISDFKMVGTIAVKQVKKRSSKTLNFIFPKKTPLDFGNSIDITDKVDENGIIRWRAPGNSKDKWSIFSFYSGPTGMKPMSDAKSHPDKKSLVVDILNSKDNEIIFNQLIGINSEYYEKIEPYFKKTFRAIFTDSQEIANEWFWTDNFFEIFESLRGYDIKPYLPACFVPNRDNQFLEVLFQNEKPCFEFYDNYIGERLRFDWLTTLSEVWCQEYIKFISKKGSKHGIKHRIQTYGMPVDILKTFGASDIPETETLFSGAIDFFKMASSAGIIYGKKQISSETFSWMKQDLTLTPLKWKIACDRLFIAGINQNIYHGWTYNKNRHIKHQIKENNQYQNIYPGYYPWAGLGFSNNLTDKSCFFSYYNILNDYVARIQYLMRGGIIKSNIAVYSQNWNYSYKHFTKEQMEEGYLDKYDSGKIKGLIPWFMRRVRSENDKKTYFQQKIGEQLMEYGYWYSHINQECIENSRIEENHFKINLGTFKVLIFPNTEHISVEVAEKLKKFVKNGIKVIFLDCLPQRNSGFLNYEEKDKKIQKILKNILKNSNNSFKFLNFSKKKLNLGKIIKKEISVNPSIIFEKRESEIEYIWRKYEKEDVIFLRNKRDDHLKLDFSIKKPVFSGSNNKDHIYLLNPWNGEIISFEKDTTSKITLINEDELKISLLFVEFESKILFFSQTPIKENYIINERSHFISKGTIIKEYDIKNNWTIAVNIRKMDSNYEKIKIPVKKLKDWRKIKNLKYVSSTGTYHTDIILNPEIHQYLNNLDKYSIYLDLGKVFHYTNIKINNTKFNTKLIPPYIFDISNSLTKNINKIEVEVGGTLQNRLIGYGKQGRGGWGKYRNRTLMPMGLLGPVKIIITKK